MNVLLSHYKKNEYPFVDRKQTVRQLVDFVKEKKYNLNGMPKLIIIIIIYLILIIIIIIIIIIIVSFNFFTFSNLNL